MIPADIDSLTETAITHLIGDGIPHDHVGALRWHDIDWDTCSLLLLRPCAHRCLLGLSLGLTDRPTHRHRHLSESTMAALASLRDRSVLRRIREGDSWYASDPVLTARDGRRLTASEVEAGAGTHHEAVMGFHTPIPRTRSAHRS